MNIIEKMTSEKPENWDINEKMTAEEIAGSIILCKCDASRDGHGYGFTPKGREYGFVPKGMKMSFTDTEKNILNERYDEIIRVYPKVIGAFGRALAEKEIAEATAKKERVNKLKRMLDDPAMHRVFQQHGCKRWKRNGRDWLYLNGYPKRKTRYGEETKFVDLNAHQIYGKDIDAYLTKIEKQAEQVRKSRLIVEKSSKYK